MEVNGMYPIQPDARALSPRKPWRGKVGAGVLLGGLALGGLAASYGGQSTLAASSAVATSTVAATTQSTAQTVALKGFGMQRAGLMVTSVSGTVINATSRGGQAITINVSAATKYSRAGASITLGDIKAGEQIAVQGTRTTQTTIAATSISVVLARQAGVVTNVNGSTLTMTSLDGSVHTIQVGSGTTYWKAERSAAASDVSAGTAILVEGSRNADGSQTAERVTIQVPSVSGQVSAVASGSYTITDDSGSAPITVNTSMGTIYVDSSGATVQPSTIVKGSNLLAEGTISADGKTLNALRVIVLPAGSSDTGGHGRFGPPDTGTTTSAAGSTATSGAPAI